ncbi:hypothetical protein DFH06DRAFT_1158824 [Mycena polygramma]|nr:hypothetical protein DFH06DRAFT_1158824 [Mycena polygramma]
MANFVELPEGYVLQVSVGKPPQEYREITSELIMDAEEFSTNPGGYEDRWDPAYTEVIEFLVPQNRTTIIGKQQRIGTNLHGQHPDILTRSIPFKTSEGEKYLIPDILLLLRFYYREHSLRLHIPIGFAELKRALPRRWTWNSYPTKPLAASRLRFTMSDAMTQAAAQAIFAFKAHKENYPDITIPTAFLIATVGPWLTIGFAHGVNDNAVLDKFFSDALQVLKDKAAVEEDISADDGREEAAPGIAFDRSVKSFSRPIADPQYFKWWHEMLNLKEDKAWEVLGTFKEVIRDNILVNCKQRGAAPFANCWLL